jgi:hypothetical protein
MYIDAINSEQKNTKQIIYIEIIMNEKPPTKSLIFNLTLQICNKLHMRNEEFKNQVRTTFHLELLTFGSFLKIKDLCGDSIFNSLENCCCDWRLNAQK